jgi:hypothetical protein
MKKPKQNKYMVSCKERGYTLAKAKQMAKDEAAYGSEVMVYELVPVVSYNVSIKEVKHK